MIRLHHIEKAIRANFILSKDQKRKLETDRYHEWQSAGIARMVFVAVAMKHGIKQDLIREYLDMSLKEFNGKIEAFRKAYNIGAVKAHQPDKYNEGRAKDLDLRIYRKTVLVENYLSSIRREFMHIL